MWQADPYRAVLLEASAPTLPWKLCFLYVSLLVQDTPALPQPSGGSETPSSQGQPSRMGQAVPVLATSCFPAVLRLDCISARPTLLLCLPHRR